jgi:hypothetical protein
VVGEIFGFVFPADGRVQNTTSTPQLEFIAHQVGMHPIKQVYTKKYLAFHSQNKCYDILCKSPTLTPRSKI